MSFLKKILEKEIFELVRVKCEGCINGYPGQRSHDCLMLDRDDHIDAHFEEAFQNKIEIVKLEILKMLKTK